MPKILQIHWKTLLISLLAIVLVFLTVVVAPYINLGRAPILLTACIFLLIALGLDKNARQVRLVDLGILALILALGITTIPSIEPHRSWVWTAGISGGLIVLLVTREIVRRWITAKQVLVGLLVTGLMFQVILTIEVFNWLGTWRELFPELGLPPQPFRFNNGNAWAAYLITLIFLQLGIFFSVKKPLGRWLMAGWMAWTFVLVYFCSSRGGMIGLGAAGLTFLIINRAVIWEWIGPMRQKLINKRWLAYSIGLIVFVGLSAALWMVFKSYEAHPTHASFGLESRTPFWIPSWNAFLQSPWWGNGFFTEANYYMSNHSIPPDGLYFHSHNMFLDILQGGGVVLAIAAGLFILTLAAGLRRARQSTTPDGMPLTMAALPVLIGFLAHSVFDSLYWMPMVSIPLVIIFGAALVSDEGKVKFKLPAAQIAAILTLLAVWGLYAVQQPYLRTIKDFKQTNWEAIATGLDESAARLPISPLFNREAGIAHANLAATGNPGELIKAIDYFQAAVDHDPNFSVNWLNLGALQRAAGNLEEARDSFETATIKADRWGLTWLNLGETCEMALDEGCARQAYLNALSLHPSWVTDPYWQESDLRKSAVMATKSAHGNTTVDPLTMDTVIRQGYSRPVLELANQKISAGELYDAERLIKLAPMLFARRESEIVDLHWLEAELAAAKGDKMLAVELGAATRDEFEKYKLNDGTVAGVLVYGQDIYQLPTLEIDLVPQVTWMEYPGDWQDRMAQLSSWQE